MSHSRWRAEALRVIEATVRTLPEGADFLATRKALQAAYPFGQRANHPYRVWCRCVREYLAQRFGWQAGEMGSAAPEVTIVLTGKRRGLVECPECGTEPTLAGGCLLCYRVRQRWAETWQGRDIAEAWEQANTDPVALAMLIDWLTEQGWPEVAESLRRAAEDVARKKRPRTHKERSELT